VGPEDEAREEFEGEGGRAESKCLGDDEPEHFPAVRWSWDGVEFVVSSFITTLL